MDKNLNINYEKSIYLNSREAAEFVRMNFKSFQNMVSSGKIPYRKFGKLNRFRIDELIKMIESNKRGPKYD